MGFHSPASAGAGRKESVNGMVRRAVFMFMEGRISWRETGQVMG
jgi:hypothetical protein